MGLPLCKNGHLIFGVESFDKRGRCKACSAAQSKKWAQDNPARMKELQQKWNESNPGRINELSVKWAKNNSERVRNNNKKWRENNLERDREKCRRYRAKLPKGYVAQFLGLKVSDVPPEMIELKRQIIIIKRELRNGINKNGK